MRKLERIAQLDSEVGQLKEENAQLVREGDTLRGELSRDDPPTSIVGSGPGQVACVSESEINCTAVSLLQSWRANDQTINSQVLADRLRLSVTVNTAGLPDGGVRLQDTLRRHLESGECRLRTENPDSTVKI